MTSANNDPAAPLRPATFSIGRVNFAGSATTLKIEFSVGYVPCYGKLGRVEVEQGAQRVTITLHRIYPEPPDPHRMCPQYRSIRWITVTLDAPLGNRSVIDGSTGKIVSVSPGGA